ncbi:MAG TPA: hypothetical protein VEO00_13795, partial [Actinomycetota bacterium]|nr:hypothetical protein [Actinomycetota bacterium]
MTLPPLPAFAVTGVGSLPDADVESAVDRVLAQAPDLPFAPQLPNRSPRERPVAQAAEGLPGVRIDDRHGWAFVEGISIPGTGTVPEDSGEPVVGDEAYAGLYRLLDRVKGSERPVKVQLTGPVTIASRVTDGRGRRAIYDSAWRRAAARAIGRKAAHLADQVRDAGCEPVVFLDEPELLGAAGPQAALSPAGAAALVAEALEEIDAPRGVHCCARV